MDFSVSLFFLLRLSTPHLRRGAMGVTHSMDEDQARNAPGCVA